MVENPLGQHRTFSVVGGGRSGLAPAGAATIPPAPDTTSAAMQATAVLLILDGDMRPLSSGCPAPECGVAGSPEVGQCVAPLVKVVMLMPAPSENVAVCGNGPGVFGVVINVPAPW